MKEVPPTVLEPLSRILKGALSWEIYPGSPLLTVDKIYDWLDSLISNVRREDNTYIMKDEPEEAVKLYLLVSKTLEESARRINDKDISPGLMLNSQRLHRDIDRTFEYAATNYAQKSYEFAKNGEYEKSNEYISKAEIFRYGIKSKAYADMEKEVSDSLNKMIKDMSLELFKEFRGLRARDIGQRAREFIAQTATRFLGSKEEISQIDKEQRSGLSSSVEKPQDIIPDQISIRNDFEQLKEKPGWYFWSVYLVADDNLINKIDHVVYTQLSTFSQSVQKVEDPTGGFKLSATGWSEFQIKADIHFKNGETITKHHWLNFGR